MRQLLGASRPTHAILCRAMYHKPPFLIPLALDIEWRGRQSGSGRYGHGLCHPGIPVTGTDDQGLHAASDRHYWKGAVDRILLRRGQWPPDRRWRVVKGPEMASIAAEVMVVCQPLVPSIRIQLSSPEQDEQKYLENCPYAGP